MRGYVTFEARRATAAELAAEGLPSEDLVEECGASAAGGRTLTAGDGEGADGESQGGGGTIGATDHRDSREMSPDPQGAGKETILEVEAKVCRSILSADITELQFLEACPGASYVKEFSVWNK